MIDKNCWWYEQPWLYQLDSGINPYDSTKIKIKLNNSFWDDKKYPYNKLSRPGVKSQSNSSYFPFIYKNKPLILYKNKSLIL